MGFRITKYDGSLSQVATKDTSPAGNNAMPTGLVEIPTTKEWMTGLGVYEVFSNTIDTSFNPTPTKLFDDPYLFYPTSKTDVYTRITTTGLTSVSTHILVGNTSYYLNSSSQTLVVTNVTTRATISTHTWSDLWGITIPSGYVMTTIGGGVSLATDGTYGYGYISFTKSTSSYDTSNYLVKFLLSDPTSSPTSTHETSYTIAYPKQIVYNVGDGSLLLSLAVSSDNTYHRIRKYNTSLTYQAEVSLGYRYTYFYGQIAPGLLGNYFWLANSQVQVSAGNLNIVFSVLEKRDSTTISFGDVLATVTPASPSQSLTSPYRYVPSYWVGSTTELKKGYITFKLEVTSNLALDAVLASSCSNVNFSVLFSASGAEAPYTYTLDNILSVTPPELTFTDNGNGTATLSGTGPITPGDYRLKFTLNADNGETLTRYRTYSIYEAPDITNATALPDANKNVAYSYFVTYTSDNSVVFEIISGLLPPGLTLNSTTGQITGTPTAIGEWSFRLRITDDISGCSSYNDHTIIVTGNVIISGTLPSICFGRPYNQTLTATGGVEPYTWSILSGTLPNTLTLDSGTGVVSGTITDTPGTYSFTVKVEDSDAPAVIGLKAYSITIYNTPTITTESLPYAYHDSFYSYILEQVGGDLPVIWSITAGILPTGLSFNTGTGTISGTPTEIESALLTFQVTSVHGCTDEKILELIVEAPPDITSGPPPSVCLTKTFFWQATADGINIPITFSISGALPAGLIFDGSTGIMQGQPSQAGVFPFVLTATDSHGLVSTKGYQVQIYNSPIIQTPYLPVGAIGKNYEFTLSLTNGTGVAPFVWLLIPVDSPQGSFLPVGITFDSANGAFVGVPQEVGTWGFKIRVQDANGCISEKIYYLQILGYPVIETTSLPPVCAKGTSLNDVSYELLDGSRIIASGGTSPYYFFITRGALPAGLTLNPYTGQISGQAIYPGITSTFVVQVVDQNSLTIEKEFSIRVRTRIECGQEDQGPTVTIVKQRLTSMESDPVVVEDPFHQKHMLEYLPVPMQGGETDNG